MKKSFWEQLRDVPPIDMLEWEFLTKHYPPCDKQAAQIAEALDAELLEEWRKRLTPVPKP